MEKAQCKEHNQIGPRNTDYLQLHHDEAQLPFFKTSEVFLDPGLNGTKPIGATNSKRFSRNVLHAIARLPPTSCDNKRRILYRMLEDFSNDLRSLVYNLLLCLLL